MYFLVVVQHHERYERLLRRARTEDLSEVSGIGCLYQSGVDKLGRPVVVFVGKWFSFNEIDLDKVGHHPPPPPTTPLSINKATTIN